MANDLYIQRKNGRVYLSFFVVIISKPSLEKMTTKSVDGLKQYDRCKFLSFY